MKKKKKSPDISQIDIEKVEKKEFSDSPNFRIKIDRITYQEIIDHCSSSNEIEVGGILVGNVFADSKGAFLEIMGAIRAENAAGRNTELTFTHDTWQHINSIKDSKYDELEVIGWYHSHPGHGIFLSEHDLFIQNNFFSLPHQTAYVFDPTDNSQGFFFWSDGEAKSVKSFWIDDEKIMLNQSNSKSEDNKFIGEFDSRIKKVEKRNYLYWISIFVVFLVASLSSLFIYSRFDSEMNKKLEGFLGKFYEQNSLPEKEISEEINSILKPEKRLYGSKLKIIFKGKSIFVVGEVFTKSHKALLEKLLRKIKKIEAVDLTGVAVNPNYLINPGESLISISQNIYGKPDFWVNIYRANRDQIFSPYFIPILGTIKLPEIDLK